MNESYDQDRVSSMVRAAGDELATGPAPAARLLMRGRAVRRRRRWASVGAVAVAAVTTVAVVTGVSMTRSATPPPVGISGPSAHQDDAQPEPGPDGGSPAAGLRARPLVTPLDLQTAPMPDQPDWMSAPWPELAPDQLSGYVDVDQAGCTTVLPDPGDGRRDGRWTTLVWPEGWTALLDDSGTPTVYDVDGMPVLTWDASGGRAQMRGWSLSSSAGSVGCADPDRAVFLVGAVVSEPVTMPATVTCAEATVSQTFPDAATVSVDQMVGGAAGPGQRAMVARLTSDRVTVVVRAGAQVLATITAIRETSGWRIHGQTTCDGLDPVDGVFAEVGDVSAGVRLTLWHCGVDPVLFDDQEWEVPRRYLPFDATNAPGDFDGRGTLTLVAPGRAVFTDDTGRELTFAPSSQLSEPPGCA